MDRLTVAFFGTTIAEGTPRGALRLFRGLSEALAERKDIDFICLFREASDQSDPFGCTYKFSSAREFLDAHSDVYGAPAFQGRLLAKAEALKTIYREWLPAGVRRRIRGLLSRAAAYLEDRDHRPRNSYSRVLRLGRSPVERQVPFSNDDIRDDFISLDDVDVLLNFWWFHSRHEDPIMGRYRPPGLRVISWFLDATPLRLPDWEPGLIPAADFRRLVQAHLEAADEVVAISRSAAHDMTIFFPHIRKPTHVVPCGIRDVIGDQAEGGELGCEIFAETCELPLFSVIGFQDPSKNVRNVLRALLSASLSTKQELQLCIVGFGTHIDVASMLGPDAPALNGRVRVISAGFVSDARRRAILGRSVALIYASKWEGFGIPPLEAMAAGTQVVVSDIPPLRELCLGLAEYCDPYDAESIAAAIIRTMRRSNSEIAAYRRRAKLHASAYTWDAAADRLVSAVLRRKREPQPDILASAPDLTGSPRRV